jgi:hypothetical protein
MGRLIPERRVVLCALCRRCLKKKEPRLPNGALRLGGPPGGLEAVPILSASQ